MGKKAAPFNPFASKTMRGKNHHRKGKAKREKKKSVKQAAKAAVTNADSKPASFLGLPGEIRNYIYDLAFDDRRVMVKHGHPRKYEKGAAKTLVHEKLPFIDRVQLERAKAIPFGLMYTCKKIYEETTTMLYSRTSFAFTSINSLRVFLERVPAPAKTSIEDVEIHHTQFGHPKETKDIWTKERYDFHFYLACKQAANDFKCLKNLKIDY